MPTVTEMTGSIGSGSSVMSDRPSWGTIGNGAAFLHLIAAPPIAREVKWAVEFESRELAQPFDVASFLSQKIWLADISVTRVTTHFSLGSDPMGRIRSLPRTSAGTSTIFEIDLGSKRMIFDGALLLDGSYVHFTRPLGFAPLFNDECCMWEVRHLSLGIDAYADSLDDLREVVEEQFAINIRDFAYADPTDLTSPAKRLRDRLRDLIGL